MSNYYSDGRGRSTQPRRSNGARGQSYSRSSGSSNRGSGRGGSNKKKGRNLLPLLLLVLLVVIGVVAGVQYFTSQQEEEQLRLQAEAQEQQNAENMVLSQDTIYEGVSINGIALGGMTKEEAVSAVEAGLGLAEHTLTLSYEEKTYPVPLLTGSDLASVVEEAYQVGRSGTREENLATIEGLAANPVNFTVEAGYSLPDMTEILAACAADINTDPVNATVTGFDVDDTSFTFSDSQAGRTVDEAKAYIAALEDGLTVEELAAKFRFSPRQIELACRQAVGLAGLEGEGTISSREMHQCCYRQVVHKLGDLASRVRPAFHWDDVVMPEDQKKLLQHACGHIKFQHQVYYGWGFDRKIAYGRGLSILFAGAPGTGKTMCAQVIANELNMEMYKINISQIVSKYIGETEKNLQAVFTEAKRSNCVLFFDECDALFGKRSEVKDAHDRNANVEVAYLLQQIEEYDGVCILATNLIGNIDEAFMRRITYVVRFPFPDAAMREEIYRRTIPQQAPLSDDIDWAFLAEKFELSGGHIKNIVLSAAFLAALEGQSIGMSHLLRSAVGEMKKNEIVVVREELREYADLLDG